MAAARSSATCEMSTAVTVQPREASQMASAPSPEPTSSAVPGVQRRRPRVTRCGFGFAAPDALGGAVPLVPELRA